MPRVRHALFRGEYLGNFLACWGFFYPSFHLQSFFYPLLAVKLFWCLYSCWFVSYLIVSGTAAINREASLGVSICAHRTTLKMTCDISVVSLIPAMRKLRLRPVDWLVRQKGCLPDSGGVCRRMLVSPILFHFHKPASSSSSSIVTSLMLTQKMMHLCCKRIDKQYHFTEQF